MIESLASRVLKLWVRTLRVNVKFLADPKPPAIVSFWHGRMFLLPFALKDYAKDVFVLVSHHRDGEIATRILRHLGFSTVRGSTGKGKGGKKAFREMLRLLEEGKYVAITPDGPRGPREKVKKGIVRLAVKAKVPIYPLSFSASSGKELGSWDRFLLPRPFSRCVVILGKPVFPGEDEDEVLKRLELELKKITKLCDRETGWKA